MDKSRLPASQPSFEQSCARQLIEVSVGNRADIQKLFETLIEESIRKSSFLEEAPTREVIEEALGEFQKAKKIPAVMSRRRSQNLLRGAFLLGHPKLRQIRTPYKKRVEEAYLLLLETRLAEKNLVESLRAAGLYKKSAFERLRIPELIRAQSANAMELGLSAALVVKFGVILPPALRLEFLPSKQQWETIVDVLIKDGPEATQKHIRSHFPLKAHANYVYGKLQRTYVYATVGIIAYLSVVEVLEQKGQFETMQAKAFQDTQTFLSNLMNEPLSPEEAQKQMLENILDTMEASQASAAKAFDRESERRKLYEKAGLEL